MLIDVGTADIPAMQLLRKMKKSRSIEEEIETEEEDQDEELVYGGMSPFSAIRARQGSIKPNLSRKGYEPREEVVTLRDEILSFLRAVGAGSPPQAIDFLCEHDLPQEIIDELLSLKQRTNEGEHEYSESLYLQTDLPPGYYAVIAFRYGLPYFSRNGENAARRCHVLDPRKEIEWDVRDKRTIERRYRRKTTRIEERIRQTTAA